MTDAWDASHARSREWRGGEWSVELRDDELADIQYRGRRVLRSIRAVVRDRDWATAALIVDRIRETDSTLTLHVRSDGLGSSFAGVVRAEARGGELRIICDLESVRAFQTNRTGLVVLHPHELAGADLAVTHAGGRTEQTRFPKAISPHQPVFDIAGLAWDDNGLAVNVRFAGDVFEMEDQRNWSDASYKTYSRPLGLPFPYAIHAGERVVQQVSVRVTEVAAAAPIATDASIVLRRGGAFPDMLVGASTAPDPAPAAPPIGQGIVVELDLSSTNWRAALERAAASEQPLDLRAILSPGDDAQLQDLALALRDMPLLRIAAFDPGLHVTDAATAAALRAALADAGIDAPVVGGARSHFTEYNRERARIPGDLDGIVIATTPLFHALGTEQLVESLGVQRVIAQQTVATASGAPVHIGPVALRPRFNNVATAPEPGPTRTDLADGYGAQFTGAVDPRQSAPELAAWTIASAAALAVPGVASIAWFEEWGPRGIRTAAGEDLPVTAAVAALADLHGATLVWADSPDGVVWAIGGSRGASTEVLVANLDDRDRTVSLVMDAVPRPVTVRARGFTRVEFDEFD